MTIGHTGTQVFNSISSNAVKEPDGSPSETDMFKMIDTAIASLKKPVADLDDAGSDMQGMSLFQLNK